MSEKYSEIVIEGSFMLAKGFLLGFLANEKPDSNYFFHRKSGIRRETFRELLKDFFELDNHAHVCLENSLCEKFKKASEFYTKITGNKVISAKEIATASFTFSYEFYNEAMSGEAKALLKNLPENVEVIDYFPYEEKVREGHGIEGYAPLHEFTARARGKFSGDFEGIMNTYLKIKKSDFSESFICGEVVLGFK